MALLEWGPHPGFAILKKFPSSPLLSKYGLLWVVILCFQISPLKQVSTLLKCFFKLTHFSTFENRSKTTRLRFLQSLPLPVPDNTLQICQLLIAAEIPECSHTLSFCTPLVLHIHSLERKAGLEFFTWNLCMPPRGCKIKWCSKGEPLSVLSLL